MSNVPAVQEPQSLGLFASIGQVLGAITGTIVTTANSINRSVTIIDNELIQVEEEQKLRLKTEMAKLIALAKEAE